MNRLTNPLERMFTLLPPTRGITAETIALYADYLSDLPVDMVCAAIDRLIVTSRFTPTIAEIREIVSLQSVAPGLIPETAWAEVQQAAGRVGYNRLPVMAGGEWHPPEQRSFSSPLIAQAVEAIGWKRICHEDDSKGFIRRDFVETLKALMQRAVRDVQTGDRPAPAEASVDDGAEIVALPERRKEGAA